MNRKWGTRILLSLIAVTILASTVRTASPPSISDISINEGFAVSSSTTPHTELDRINTSGLTVGNAAVQKDNVPFHPVSCTGHRNLYVSIENLHISESSCLAKDYLYFIYPSHHFW